jgi:hypothetical protein
MIVNGLWVLKLGIIYYCVCVYESKDNAFRSEKRSKKRDFLGK